MVYCSDCGRKLGFYQKKNKLDNGNILCNFCYDKYLSDENKKKNDKSKIINKDKLREYQRYVKEKDNKQKKQRGGGADRGVF